MAVTIDLATLVAFLALALAAHLYIRLHSRELSDEQRRAGRIDDFNRADATGTEGALPGRNRDRNSTVIDDRANSDNAPIDVPGRHRSNSDACRDVKGGPVANTADELGEDTGVAAPGPSTITAPSQVSPSTPRARSSMPVALPATPPPTAPTRKETRIHEVAPASRPSKAKRSSTPAGVPLPRQQFLAAFPPSIPGSPPPRQRLMAALPKPASSLSAVKMEVNPPVLPPGQRKGKARARADSPVPTRVSFTTPRTAISAMSTLTSIPTVSSRSTTPGSSMTLLVQEDDEMEVDQVFAPFYKCLTKHRSLALKPGQEVPDVVMTTWFRSEGQGRIGQPPPDASLETPTVGDVFCHRLNEYTPPIFQLFLRVLQDDGTPGWLEVDQGIRRDDGMRLIVTPSTHEASWVGESQCRSVMRQTGNFQSPLRLSTPASESSLSSLSDA
ncbi:hypothetical protein C8T65DRAFT_740760 [Cerioporus squamosus]|nr:hypothetical protein C8T65DRAFT_740760 [Cerioporus squamosus]